VTQSSFGVDILDIPSTETPTEVLLIVKQPGLVAPEKYI
jgi:hypothetical protein